jgi:hypothetical protein
MMVRMWSTNTLLPSGDWSFHGSTGKRGSVGPTCVDARKNIIVRVACRARRRAERQVLLLAVLSRSNSPST